ncbi:hypothetical protein M0654_20220 [Rhizobium sp. NTR19]|uniref:Uncharacterized protein n=1 Tax=Neorhizobium turbinariae TaxID=2937795 RepID=A0ABT0IWP5_9HYPH|nr:hypothetical protein [Neorhizobium turbinariae]MCK8782308.1 hypothetical protein [Neorhizobium turbinariae]
MQQAFDAKDSVDFLHTFMGYKRLRNETVAVIMAKSCRSIGPWSDRSKQARRHIPWMKIRPEILALLIAIVLVAVAGLALAELADLTLSARFSS